MSSTTMHHEDASTDMWAVTTRVIVYAAIGAALYGVAAVFSILIPGTANVSVRPAFALVTFFGFRSEEHTSELQSRENLVCRLLLEKKNDKTACNPQQ